MWSASLSSSVSRGEGGQAGDPMNCSGVRVKYLKIILWSSLLWSLPDQVLALPDEVLHTLKLLPAGIWTLLLPSSSALRPRPSGQRGDFTF